MPTIRRGSVVASTSAWHALVRGSIPGSGMLCFRLSVRDCISCWGGVAQWLERCFETWASSFTPYCLYLSDEILKAVGPFYLVSMSGEVKGPTQCVNV